MKEEDIDMKTIDIAIQSLKGEREDNDQFNAGMYYIRDLIEPYYNNLIKENKRLNNIIDELEKDILDIYNSHYNIKDKHIIAIYNRLKELKEGK